MARPGGEWRRGLGLGLWLALVLSASAAAQVNVIPEPLSVQTAMGDPVIVADGAALIVPRKDQDAQDAARELIDLALKTRGLHLTLQAGGPTPARGAAIVFERRRGMGAEAYALDIGGGRARISASTGAGFFYGAVTLWELLTADSARGPAALQPMSLQDSPRFAWRGLMLDSARHFQPPAEVEQLIDWMALHKLNLLHWHLTDDQGWRLQVLKYPRLTEVGAWRTPLPGSPDFILDPRTGQPMRYGGFYTQAEVREVAAYAAARHITIVPEIEMPGHALSALLAYPALGVGAPPLPEDQSKWGGFSYVYNVDDRTLGAIEDVLTEVMALFPGRYIHVGGDEAAKQRWEESPEVQTRMKALGISDTAALQRYFTGRIAAFLAAHGRRLVGWDEILQGGALPGEAVVMSWHGASGALAAAQAGHDTVLAPAPTLYFDNRQGDGATEPPGRGLVVSLHDVYAFEALPAGFDPALSPHILGLQGNIWTEHVRTWDQLQAMAFPRVAALAEAAWSVPARRDWPGFVGRLPAEMSRYAALGIKADGAALAVRIDAAPGADASQAVVALSTQTGLGEIRYTTDGSAPTAASPRYDQPITTVLPGRLRAALFLDGAEVSPIAERPLDGLSIRRRTSQELKLCDDKLALNLEGAGGAAPHPVYLTNPVDSCWIYTAADLDGVSQVTAAIGRLPFMFGLDSAHDSVVVHPPQTPSGELEVRQDSCASEPIAVAPLTGSTSLTLDLPPRAGRHDLCFSFTSTGFDPVLTLDWVQLAPAAAKAGTER